MASFSVVVTLVPSKSGKTETNAGKPYRVAQQEKSRGNRGGALPGEYQAERNEHQ